MDSRLYWIWLAQAFSPGEANIPRLLDYGGDAKGVYEATEEELTVAGFSKEVRRKLNNKSLEEAREILDRVLEAEDWILTPADSRYPEALRQLTDYPAVLYGRGSVPDWELHPAVAVVGTRHASSVGCQEAYSLASGLAKGGLTVVSGGAVGIDTAAHTGALDAGGVTVAVLGCPLDVEYPVENTALRQRIVAQGGALLSEYPHGQPYRCDFHVRNRLLAGLSLGVCLGETPLRSGARITARLARDNGRDVFALPGALLEHRHDGAHKEIQGGAMLVTKASDILSGYASVVSVALDCAGADALQKQLESKTYALPEKKKRSAVKKPATAVQKPPKEPDTPSLPAQLPATLSDTAREIAKQLTADPTPVDDIAARMGLPVPLVLVGLTELEMNGCAANAAGQRYYRI